METNGPRSAEFNPDLKQETTLDESGMDTLDPTDEKRLVRKIDWM